MIEGTQSPPADLLLFEFEHKPGVPLDDVQEVSNYAAALNHGLNVLRRIFLFHSGRCVANTQLNKMPADWN